MRRFDVRPDRDLGQNFLIDSNILGVIERAAELAAEDVVLEIGGGLGVLSEHLAERCAHLHVVEVDTRLADALRDATERFANVTLHFQDAMRADLQLLRPAPTKVVANLPNGIAASALLRTIEDAWGMPPLGHAAGASPLADFFATNGSGPTVPPPPTMPPTASLQDTALV